MWTIILISQNKAGKTSTFQDTFEDYEQARRCLITHKPKRGYQLCEVNMYRVNTLFNDGEFNV